MAYSIFLVENLKTQNSTPLYSGTSDFTLSNGFTYLHSVPRMDITTGMFIYIDSSRYTIEKFTYTEITETYKFTLYPSATSGTYPTQSWQIFDYTSVENHAELDCEQLDLEIEFKVGDIADITSRTDTITKNIQLKGTAANNLAFGNAFFLNKRTDFNISNLLGFNFNSLRPVDCLIYENGNLILRGNLYITEITKDRRNNIVYNCTVTGKLSGLKSVLGDSLLADLDFSDLKHPYSLLQIVDSWGSKNVGSPNNYGNSVTTMWNSETDSFYQVPFAYGKNYVYPYIDYGEKFLNDNANLTYYSTPIYNYRPAVYVREYLNRIFIQNGLSYELLGGEEFLENFNRLIIPNNEKMFSTNLKGVLDTLQKSTSQTNDFNNINQENNNRRVYPIRFDVQDSSFLLGFYPLPFPVVSTEFPLAQRQQNILICQRNFTSEGRINIQGEFISLTSDSADSSIIVQLSKRENTTDESVDFTSIAETVIQGEQGISEYFNLTFDIPSTEFSKGDQLQLRVIRPYFFSDESYNASYFNITSASLQFSKDNTSVITANVELDDVITPSAPAEIKQIDFVKGLISLFNFYVYTKRDNPKKYYFEQYDNYYGLATTSNLREQSLDWTNKVDFSQSWKWKSNIQLPKNYRFQYKTDKDILNKSYNDTYSQPYGSLSFADSLGLSSDKVIEPLFSPTVMASVPGVNRFSPFIIDGNTSLTGKEKIKSNIRILYYSGVHASASYMRFAVDQPLGGGLLWDTSEVFATNWQPVVSNYLFDSSTDIFHSPYNVDGTAKTWVPVRDLHFATPKAFNFVPTNDYYGLTDSYNFYINQISELTNPNLYTIELYVLLSSFDIANLNLRTPVLIDSGDFGYSYFKILNLVYGGEGRTSKVTLQKIVL